LDWRLFSRFNPREHAAILVLGSLSNLFLSIPEYLAVRQALVSYTPVDPSTAHLVSVYGLDLGLELDFLWTLAIFQVILVAIVLVMATTPYLKSGWRVAYVFSGIVVWGFVGYWLAAKFLRALDWISLLQNSSVDASTVYSELFWFGLLAAIFYVAVILVMRRSYDKLIASGIQIRQ
jgi:hypothetical protein